MTSYRPDLELWVDNYFQGIVGLSKRKTFGKPSYYLGKQLFAFVFDDGIVIKTGKAKAAELIAAFPQKYSYFEPGDGKMKNWILIVRSEDFEYEQEIPLIEASLESL